MKKIIAILDDQEEMRDIYPLIFKEHIDLCLLELNFFHDPQRFLGWLRLKTPDLCLIDIEMPRMSGPEILRHSNLCMKDVLLYFVSGHSSEDYQEEIREFNIKRFFTKPFNIRHLIDSVNNDLNLNKTISNSL